MVQDLFHQQYVPPLFGKYVSIEIMGCVCVCVENGRFILERQLEIHAFWKLNPDYLGCVYADVLRILHVFMVIFYGFYHAKSPLFTNIWENMSYLF